MGEWKASSSVFGSVSGKLELLRCLQAFALYLRIRPGSSRREAPGVVVVVVEEAGMSEPTNKDTV
jgi:hypothetical protein